jgi:ribosomal protein S21
MRRANVVVVVENGNVELALKKLKKKLATSGVLTLMKQQSALFAFQKPSVQRRLKAIKARRRARKLERAQQREFAWIDGDRRAP